MMRLKYPIMKTPSEQVESAWVLLVRAQQVLLNHVEAQLKACGLPPLSWYDVLLELSRDSHAGLRQYEIAERILLTKHNMSRLIDRLEGAGYVERRVCDEDGRGNVVHITKKGVKLKQDMWPVYARAIQTLIGDALSASQIQSLTESMRALLAHHREASA